MDPEAFGKWLSGEIGVVAHVSFWIVIGVAALLIWRAMEWRYGGIIAKLREEHPSKEGPKEVRAATADASPAPNTPTPRVRALKSLKAARDNAVVALHQGNYHSHRRAFHEAEAAMLSIQQHFGIDQMKIPESDDPPYRVLVEAYLSFIDRFYPLLCEGHLEKARERASSFKWSWGEPEF